MNKISPLAFILCLALAGMQVSAENWIKNADGSPSWIDTDSIRQEQAISSFDMRLESSDFTVVSTMEFDTSKNTWRTAALVTRDKDGKVLHAEKKENPDDGWNKLIPGTYGKNLYRHYVETPLPPPDAKWKQLYKDNRAQPSPLTQILSVIKMAMPTSGLPWKPLIRKRIYPGSFTG